MRWRAVQGGYAVVLQRGDDLLECLKQLARETNLRAGFFTGLGAACDVQIAYWDMERREYLRSELDGDQEIGVLTGNISQLEGQPFVHAHAVLSGHDFLARTGHVMRARVSATVEIFVHDFGGAIHRGMDAGVGLNLWQL
jgi:uncharacterized protein